MVAGQGQLVAATRRRTVDRADVALARVGAGILDAVTGLIGELAEVDLERVFGLGQHADVGTGAEHPIVARRYYDRSNLGVLEPETLHGVVQLYIHAQIVGVELELVSRI